MQHRRIQQIAKNKLRTQVFLCSIRHLILFSISMVQCT